MSSTDPKSLFSQGATASKRNQMVGAKIPADLVGRVDKFCRSHDVSRSYVIRTALSRFFDAENDVETIIARQLARQDRRLRVLDEKISALADMHLLSQRYFFAHHRPYVSETEREQAQRNSNEAYAKYRDVLKEFLRNGGLFQEINSLLSDTAESSNDEPVTEDE